MLKLMLENSTNVYYLLVKFLTQQCLASWWVSDVFCHDDEGNFSSWTYCKFDSVEAQNLRKVITIIAWKNII